jgi:transcriptional regulator with XRE-family HTH domain
MDLSRFTILLEKAFLEYRIRQTRQRLSVSLNSFANYLDFSPPIVNLWLSGSRLPTQGNVERLIPKLVELLDFEVYDVLGLPRPDPDLQRLNRVWPRIPKEYRQMLANQAEKYATEDHSSIENTLPPVGPKEVNECHSENAAPSVNTNATSTSGSPGSSEQGIGLIPV